MTETAALRPRRTWDVVLTIILLLIAIVVTIIASFLGVFLAFASDSCVVNDCNYDAIGAGMYIAMGGVWLPLIAAVVVSIVMLVRRRLAFWVPLAGIALIAAVFAAGAGLVFAAAGVR